MTDRDLVTATYAVLAVLVSVAAVVGVADYRASLTDGGVEGPAADCPGVDGVDGSGTSGDGADAEAGDGKRGAAPGSTPGGDCDAGPETVATTGAS